ncbi:hypothetical protein MRX96_043286 [Rhipicephalus microplus]
MTQRTLYFSWPRLVASVLQVHGTEHVLETMFDQLKKASHQARMLKWLSTPMRLAAQQRIRLVGLVVTSRRMSSMAATMNDGTSRYARLVSELAERKDISFTELYIRVMALVQGVRVRSPPMRAELEVPIWEHHSELAYSWITTSAMVPTLYQLAPYFYPIGVPAHFNYATVGALLATAIAESVAPVISLPNGTGRGGHRRSDAWWTRGAMRKYRISAALLRTDAQPPGLAAPARRQRRVAASRVAAARPGPTARVRRPPGELWQVAWARSLRAPCAWWRFTTCPSSATAFDCVSREDFVAQQCLP